MSYYSNLWDIGLRICRFCSEMVNNRHVIFFCFWGLCNSLLMDLGQEPQQHPALHSEGLAVGGSVAVAVGISDMCQLRGDR